MRATRSRGLGVAIGLAATPAAADVVPAAPERPVVVQRDDGGAERGRVILHVVVSESGSVEAIEIAGSEPANLPGAVVTAAVRAVRATTFRPSMQDGSAVRSRIALVVDVRPQQRPLAEAPSGRRAAEATQATGPTEPTDDAREAVIEVRGTWPSPRGLGDIRVAREQLEASPRQHTTELLSAAPGFFVDHEFGEGLGNDVYLRGFDLDNGSGIEMRVAGIPTNSPSHILGQGYADVNFVIPEVVRGIRVLQGTYDPRQGDAAIVGSAYFDLGVTERGYRTATSYGSFGQVRVLGIAAPERAHDDTFAAVAVRRADGFGARRQTDSGTVNTQLRFDLSAADAVTVLIAAHAARAQLPGVIREDDAEAGRIDYYGSYPFFADNQAIETARVVLGARYERREHGTLLTASPWVTYNTLAARQNYAGALETGQLDPRLSGLGDLFENANRERAAGIDAAFRTARTPVGSNAEIVFEPGLVVRVGATEQEKNLLVPSTLAVWDRRIDADIQTIDVGAYLDADARLFERLRISGGPRLDVLAMSVSDRLADLRATTPAGSLAPSAQRDALGFTFGPRVNAELTVSPALAVGVSYGEGFRSLDAERLADGATKPYSKVRSVEAGLRAEDGRGRHRTTLAVFNTWVGNELVFEAESGAFETQGASVRRGVVGSYLTRPAAWLLASTALSVTDARFATLVPGIARRVPNVPPLLFRTDVTVRGRVVHAGDHWVTGRVGLGYTLLSGRPLAIRSRSPVTNALNASAAARYGALELGLDVYNALGLEYPDQANVYISNWSLSPGQQPASVATHLTAAPPRTFLGTATLYL